MLFKPDFYEVKDIKELSIRGMKKGGFSDIFSGKVVGPACPWAGLVQGESLRAKFQFSMRTNSKNWNRTKKLHVPEQSEGKNFVENCIFTHYCSRGVVVVAPFCHEVAYIYTFVSLRFTYKIGNFLKILVKKWLKCYFVKWKFFSSYKCNPGGYHSNYWV